MGCNQRYIINRKRVIEAINTINSCLPEDSGVQAITLNQVNSCSTLEDVQSVLALQLEKAICWLWSQLESVPTLEAVQAMIDAAVAPLQAAIDALEVDVTALQGDVATLQGDISTLQGQQASYLTKADNLASVANKYTALQNLAASSLQTFGNVNYDATAPVSGGNLLISTTVTLTAPRQVKLPPTTQMQDGAIVTVADAFGVAGGVNTVTIIADLGAGDSINQGVGSFIINSAFGSKRFACLPFASSWVSI